MRADSTVKGDLFYREAARKLPAGGQARFARRWHGDRGWTHVERPDISVRRFVSSVGVGCPGLSSVPA
jgi:hypothetical protein